MKEGTRKLLEKAERAIAATRALLDSGSAEFAAGRAYYAMFYVAEALLHERGFRFSKHSGTHAAYGREFAKTGILDPEFHRWLLHAFDTRAEADYGFEVVISAEDVERMMERAGVFLAAARDFLSNTPPDSFES